MSFDAQDGGPGAAGDGPDSAAVPTGPTSVRADEAAGRLLVVLDVDGTVLLEDGTYSPGVVDAVRDTVAAGHIVTLATGRSWESTHEVLEGLGIDPQYVVCSNGAATLIRDPQSPTGYERHATETFDTTQVLTLLRRHLPAAQYMVELPDGQRLYTRYLEDWRLAHAQEVDFDELVGLHVSRIVVVSPDHEEEDFLELIEQIGLNQVSYAVGWTAWLDIAPQGVDKGTALEPVRESLGIAPQGVVVMGDGRNDVGMMRWAAELGGRAIVMGQAPPEVREAGTELTGSVEDGGVAAALTRLGTASFVE